MTKQLFTLTFLVTACAAQSTLCMNQLAQDEPYIRTKKSKPALICNVDNQTKAITGVASVGGWLAESEIKDLHELKFPSDLTNSKSEMAWLEAGFNLAKTGNNKVIVPFTQSNKDKTRCLATILYLTGPNSIVKVTERDPEQNPALLLNSEDHGKLINAFERVSETRDIVSNLYALTEKHVDETEKHVKKSQE